MKNDFRKPIVLIAQPGQELRVYGWIARQQPEIWIWTDGSGESTWGRTNMSHKLIEECGAIVCAGSGESSGREMLKAIQQGRHDEILREFHRIVEFIRAYHPTDVLTNAAEGCDVLSDLLCYLVSAAIAKLNRSGMTIQHWEACVLGAPISVVPVYGDHVDLMEDEYLSKLIALESYTDLGPEIHELNQRYGAPKHRREVIHRALPWVLPIREITKPKYESQTIRYAEKVWPILAEIDQVLERRTAA